ncbi:MAG: hypothetical protein J6A01_07575 [Proteobacteria bacterium]|nr:hypothetical protein [Pseudomonadota bacterium]
MTSTPTNGSKRTILIPILSAGLIIAFLIFFGLESPKYTQSPRDFIPHEGKFYRLEGTAISLQIEGAYRQAQLCAEDHCIPIAVSPEQPLSTKDTLIVEGIWKDNRLIVSKILRRCDGHPFL